MMCPKRVRHLLGAHHKRKGFLLLGDNQSLRTQKQTSLIGRREQAFLLRSPQKDQAKCLAFALRVEKSALQKPALR
jgi:hypothetical protein